MKWNLFFTVALSVFFTSLTADDSAESKDEEPLKEGIFSLPPSQIPGPLVSFGLTLIGKGVTQFTVYADSIKQEKRSYRNDILPTIAYGITDDLALNFTVPFTPGSKSFNDRSSGLEDAYVQLEYAYYTKSTKSSVNQATVVGALSIPLGSSHASPTTGYGSPSLFLGLTFNHFDRDWYYYISPGVTLPNSYRGTRFGNQYYYQFGIGRGIVTSPKWILAWLFELDGFCYKKNKVDGVIDNNTGGNIIWATPSLFLSTEKLLFQMGVSLPLQQHFFGAQPEVYYSLDVNFGYTF